MSVQNVPKNWTLKKLEDICDLQAGKFISAEEISNELKNSFIYPCYGGNGLRGYVKKFSHNGHYPLIGRQGALCGNVNSVSGTFYATEHAVVATVQNITDSAWLYYGLQFLNLNQYATGAAQPGLSVANINKVPILLPPLPEQKAIADLLSTWDTAIEKMERLIDVKGKVLTRSLQTLISNNCACWPHFKMNEIFKEFSKKNCPDAELLSVTQDRGVIPRSMLDGRVMSPDGTLDTYKYINSGDFVVSLRSFQGGLEYSEYSGIISPAYTVLKPARKISNNFYKIFFKTYIFIEKYLSMSVVGIRDGKQISIPDLMATKIPFPPFEEQERIASNILLFQKELDLMRNILDKYKLQKRGLMQKLLTGEWRVKTN